MPLSGSIFWHEIIAREVWDTKTKNGLIKGITRFLDEEQYLLIQNASERSICFRLGHYLQNIFRKNWIVDCEYNIQGYDPKSVDLPPDPDTIVEPFERERLVYPDIIIHSRGDGGHNHVVFEIKKTSNSISDDWDRLKLKAYMNQLDYDYGIFLRIQSGNQQRNGIERIEVFSNRFGIN